MDHSPYLDRPLLPLAVALPRMLERVGVELATAGPAKAQRLRQRAPVDPRSAHAEGAIAYSVVI
jgi:hypothetical protein